MIKLLLLMTAILGSILGYYVINLFITPVNVYQYLGIEAVVTAFHLIYNKVKARVDIA